MKKIVLLIALCSLFLPAYSQILQPALWSYDVSVRTIEEGDEVDLIFNAEIDNDWYLYSTDFDPDCGPTVTTFTFNQDPSYQLVGELKPIGAKKKFDETFECDYTYFRESAQFIQRIKIRSTDLNITGTYEYQVCTDINGMCIAFDDEFDFSPFINVKAAKTSSTNTSVQKEKTPVKEPVVYEVIDSTDLEIADTQDTEAPIENSLTEDVKVYEIETTEEESSLWGFMVLAFLTGLAALITPCVFPMIPMTVTFFMKDNESNKGNGVKKGITFGVSIILIYTLLGTFFAFILGADGLNAMATHWLPNVFIFIIFIVFALSFLGLFEITLPSAFVNKVDKQADRGGLVGVFFMAFTLALVSFSCTVPIVGSVLVLSAGGEIIKPILGMLSFSLAFALPFTLFAIFPNWLKSLPKSGGWLNSVKVMLGFLELALGLKFLSVADQAYHWGLLDREIYLAFWIVIFTMMGFYLLGKIVLPHDDKLEKTGVFRLLVATLIFTFVVYLIPGMFGAPLKMLAGYLPPQSTHDFDVPALIEENSGNSSESALCDLPKYANILHYPHGLKGYFDYQQAVACAKQQNKPIFIDFTGHGCVNCRKMEERVWSDPEVLHRLKNDFVMLALYVDDKTTLPEEEWYTSEYDGKIKKTIGKQNADFQITRFHNNAQPYYIILDPNENLLMQPKAYDLNVSTFVAFLEEAKRKMN
ncbi:MAG: thioredoxin family protein [Cyclobacteriaceae bacterium]|nr:thioredoxin family protein [Cyclobacteriaceae bacterium]